MIKFPSQGLYAITQTEGKIPETILNEVSLALKGGVSVVQYRDKTPNDDGITLAKALLTLCHQFNVPLLINDNVKLAQTIGADGVHLGKDDGDILSARQQLGANAIIGVSCYDDVTTALHAEKRGVNYVAFGRFYPSASKPNAPTAHLKTLRLAKEKINLPIVAIGGILPSNGQTLLQAGADILAVIDGLFAHAPEQSAKDYLALFST